MDWRKQQAATRDNVRADVTAGIRERIPGHQAACILPISMRRDLGLSRCHQSAARIQAASSYRGAFVARCGERRFGAEAPEAEIGTTKVGEIVAALNREDRMFIALWL